jgi:plastocyanin
MNLRRLIRSAAIPGALLAGAALAAESMRPEPPIDEAERARLIKQLQQERDHLDTLIRQLQQGRSEGETTAASSLAGAREAESEMAGSASAGERSAKRGGGKGAGSGVLSGKVVVDGDASPSDAVVYVADVQGAPSRDKIAIKQLNKQFMPRVTVVPRGTRVDFPNEDSVFHNVFSLSPGNNFDLGTYRAGDKPGSVVLATPGVVKVFCNLHSQMSASILVVPGNLFTRASADGSFRLTGIPPGKHKIAVWAPNADPVTRELDIRDRGETQVSLRIAAKQSTAAHTNKLGQPYGSYNE